MNKFLILALASTLLGGCAGTKWDTTAGGTPITMKAINDELLTPAAARAAAQQQQASQAVLTPAYAPPQVQPVTPPAGDTAIVSCRDVTGNIVSCRRLN